MRIAPTQTVQTTDVQPFEDRKKVLNNPESCSVVVSIRFVSFNKGNSLKQTNTKTRHNEKCLKKSNLNLSLKKSGHI